MSLADMVRVCTVSGAAIIGAMVMLGVLMIAQKPELRLVLEATPPAPSAQIPVPGVAGATVEPNGVRVAEADVQPAS